MSNGYRLVRAEPNNDWDSFVENSAQGTIFSRTDYLDALDFSYALYYCYKKKEIRAAVALIVDASKKNTIFHDFIIYNGIIFAPFAYRQNIAQLHSEQFRIMSFVAEELPKIYTNISLRLHPSIIDIRPFLWVNYGTDELKYVTGLRYTSYLNISDFATAEKDDQIESFKNASSSRRQEIRYAARKGVKTIEEFNAEKFVGFYRQTMERQSVEVSNNVAKEMQKLITALYEKQLGRMFVSYNSEGIVGSMAVFGIDTKRAYYIFGANDPKLRDAHTGTAVLWDTFKALNLSGVKEVDLEGINSPKRGWFKLSFGGDIRPYFEISKL